MSIVIAVLRIHVGHYFVCQVFKFGSLQTCCRVSSQTCRTTSLRLDRIPRTKFHPCRTTFQKFCHSPDGIQKLRPSHGVFRFRCCAKAALVGPLYVCSTMLVTVPTTSLIFWYAFLMDAKVHAATLSIVVGQILSWSLLSCTFRWELLIDFDNWIV